MRQAVEQPYRDTLPMANVCHASSKVAAKDAMKLPKMQGLEKLSAVTSECQVDCLGRAIVICRDPPFTLLPCPSCTPKIRARSLSLQSTCLGLNQMHAIHACGMYCGMVAVASVLNRRVPAAGRAGHTPRSGRPSNQVRLTEAMTDDEL